MTPHDREREARERVYWAAYHLQDEGVRMKEAVDALVAAIEARVRWDQQADAEGYDIPGGPR